MFYNFQGTVATVHTMQHECIISARVSSTVDHVVGPNPVPSRELEAARETWGLLVLSSPWRHTLSHPRMCVRK